nr:7909_t:CDS:2 [Entrophospora candida]
MPDINLAIKTINAIAGNYCSYTIKSKRKLIGAKGQQIWKYSYQIDRNPYKGLGFDNQDVITRNSHNPIAPVLPPYKPYPTLIPTATTTMYMTLKERKRATGAYNTT